MFLQQSEPVARIVNFHSMDSESIPKSMGAYAMYSASLSVDKVRKPSPFRTLPGYLPSSVPINAKNEAITSS
jgi:hypothetical protein